MSRKQRSKHIYDRGGYWLMTSPYSSTVRRNLIGPLAHPPERTYPCCIPALGEFSTDNAVRGIWRNHRDSHR